MNNNFAQTNFLGHFKWDYKKLNMGEIWPGEWENMGEYFFKRSPEEIEDATKFYVKKWGFNREIKDGSYNLNQRLLNAVEEVKEKVRNLKARKKVLKKTYPNSPELVEIKAELDRLNKKADSVLEIYTKNNGDGSGFSNPFSFENMQYDM